MSYFINRFKGGSLLGTGRWSGMPFEQAKDHAKETVETGMADRVEIRDVNNQLVYHYPRVTRPA